MSQQLIYTSAPRGLKPGSRGFCTVATTPGMPSNLADRLEALSAYRHIFAPGDPRNPVNYSFLSFTLGGRRLYVLSRAADAGLDYTQRTNKIAHHVVLEQNELPPAGPAALLMQPGFMETAWSGEPRTLSPPPIPPVQAPPRKCELWEQLTGDAGWGGYLVEPPNARPGQPVILIYRHDTPVLPLLAEAMVLLPPERRWQTTFSTYHTKLPPGLECQWRCMVEGSAEAQLVERQRDVVVIRLGELLRSRPALPVTTLVEAARSGTVPSRQVIDSGGVTTGSKVQLEDDELEAELRFADELAPKTPTRSLEPPAADYTLPRPVAPLPPLDRRFDYTSPPPADAKLRTRTRLGLNRRSGSWIWIAALAAIVLVAWVTVFAISFLNDRKTEIAEALADPPPTNSRDPHDGMGNRRDTVPSTDSDKGRGNSASGSPAARESGPNDRGEATEALPLQNPGEGGMVDRGSQAQSSASENRAEIDRQDELQYATNRKLISQLPDAIELQEIKQVDATNEPPTKLADGPWSEATGIMVSLIPTTDYKFLNTATYFDIKATRKGEFVFLKGADFLDSRPVPIGKLRAQDNGLFFYWEPVTKASDDARYVRNYVLRVKLEVDHNKTDSVNVFLRRPERGKPLEVSAMKSMTDAPVTIASTRIVVKAIPPEAILELEVELPATLDAGVLKGTAAIPHRLSVSSGSAKLKNNIDLSFVGNYDGDSQTATVKIQYEGIDLRNDQLGSWDFGKLNRYKARSDRFVVLPSDLQKIAAHIRNTDKASKLKERNNKDGELKNTIVDQRKRQIEDEITKVDGIIADLEAKAIHLEHVGKQLDGLRSVKVHWTVNLVMQETRIRIATSKEAKGETEF